MLVGLDTNVVSVLARGERPELRAALESAVAAGVVRVPLTIPLAREVCAVAPDPEQHARMAALLRSVCRELLTPYPRRVVQEVGHGHRLSEREAFIKGTQVNKVLQGIETRDNALAKGRPLSKEKAAFVEEWRARGERFAGLIAQTGLDKNQIKSQRKWLTDDPYRATAYWMTPELEKVCAQIKLQAPRRATPETSPSLWYNFSYTAGLVLLIQRGAAPRPGDQTDCHHVCEAAYLDRFVTEDARIREIMAWAPVPRGQFINMDGLGGLLSELLPR